MWTHGDPAPHSSPSPHFRPIPIVAKRSPISATAVLLFDLAEGNVAFLHTLVALRRTTCDVWQLECQASNVTASVQSDHLLHGCILPVFFATDQLHSPPRSSEIQPMLQQGASATRLYCGFVLDTSALAACPRRGNLPG